MYGFEADHETVNEPEAETLRTVAEKLVAGQAFARVVDHLNTEGIPPVKADRWRVNTVQNILLNPRVIPIIGQETYDTLVRMYDSRTRRSGRPAEWLLSGILRCGREGCGEPLYAAVQGEGRKQVYRCHLKGGGGRHNGCGKTAVSLRRADAWAEEAFIAAVVSDDFAEALSRRQAELLATDVTAADLDDWRQEIAELEQVLPTRFASKAMRRRHDDLQQMVRQATAALVQRPDLQALLDLPKTEAKLRERWQSWSVTDRRTWLRRVFEHVAVKPATGKGRGSDVESRMEPKWRI